MSILIVLDNPKDWDLDIPDVEVVSSKDYLTNPDFVDRSDIKVFNICKSYRYQTYGYYVSLLAEARKHKPVPNINTIQDIKSLTIIKFASEELENLMQRSFENLKSEKFVLSIYFGKNFSTKYDRLARHLFKLFHAPFLKAFFSFNINSKKWVLQNIDSMSFSEIPQAHKEFVVSSAKEYFSKKNPVTSKKSQSGYDMAILFDPDVEDKPSDLKAIKHFIKAANHMGINVELITKEDYSRLAEFDMLFIRETTAVNHHTYRFSRRAEAEGLVVIDDPQSIIRCSNKVYLSELMNKNNIKAPKTIIINSKTDLNEIVDILKFPIILKQPDSAFSQGVAKVSDMDSFSSSVTQLLSKSDMIIAQEFVPTEFDWRIGVIDKQPLYAFKYYMAGKHWQIVSRKLGGKARYGKVEAISIELVPKEVLKAALKICNLIGDGLYGVDLKEVNGEVYVIEVNDNPNLDFGFEDMFLKDALYFKIMSVFLNRAEKKKFRVYV
ncbi:RimK family protein [Candidatus Woesearchaeota archaeon]|nr:RimK family protein [Candidatus Woesearchaeota archaeon]MCF7901613.1 RimK family protein [Candidatus Woesearchaeota archaeon]MCF8014074.1 RimK family protein [Candidatus Woesearchaeota archaeon]